MDPVESRQTLPQIDPTEQDERARARLLRAGVEVFDRKGYAAASVREIVERAGLTKPALYYHFGSKEGLLLAIVAAALKEFEQAVSIAVARPGDARTRLSSLCEEVYRLFSRHVPVVRVAHTVTFGPPEGGPRLDLEVPSRIMTNAVRVIVEAGIESGEFRQVPAEDITLIILGLIGECIHQEIHGGRPFDPVGIRRALGLVFEGVVSHAGEEKARP